MKTEKTHCLFCGGTGQRLCVTCNGTGKRPRILSGLSDHNVADKLCTFCNGTGKRPCPSCNGKGYTEIMVPEFGTMNAGIPHSDLGLTDWTRERWPKSKSMIRPEPEEKARVTHEKSVESSVFLIATLAVVLGVALAIASFGYARTLVAAEGFFICGGWLGLRYARWLGGQESRRLESFRVWMAIGSGLCSGLLAAWLLLTTHEGQVITDWVTAQTIRLVGSLFGAVTTLGLVELIWHRVFG